MEEQRARVAEAVRPTDHDLAVAADALLPALAAGALPTTMLRDAVATALEGEPLPAIAEGLQGVQEAGLKKARAAATTLTALAHLEAEGAILLLGSRRVHQWADWTIVPFQLGGFGSGYRMEDPYNYDLADAYGLSRSTHVGESPSLIVERLRGVAGPKAHRLIAEATLAYRRGLFVGTAILIGVASEAAWDELARATEATMGDAKLRQLLDDQLGSAARVQQRVVDLLLPRKLIPDAALRSLAQTAETYRSLRNHAVHEGEETFDDALFTRAAVGTLLTGSVDYFRRLYELRDRSAA